MKTFFYYFFMFIIPLLCALVIVIIFIKIGDILSPLTEEDIKIKPKELTRELTKYEKALIEKDSNDFLIRMYQQRKYQLDQYNSILLTLNKKGLKNYGKDIEEVNEKIIELFKKNIEIESKMYED